MRRSSGCNDTGMVGLAQHGLLLNKETGSVGGLAIDDLVVLSLYVQDDGLLDRLDEPGTIRIGFRGGDIATISIAPAR